MTVKGPSLGGTRYEVEHTLDPYVAIELVKRGGKTIIKNRYSAWIGQDGWVIDIFGGDNAGLIIAECERMSPVVDLEIPKFCIEEVTDNSDFTNDSLVNVPYKEFRDEYIKGLEERINQSSVHFSRAFGENRLA
jgi:CYTH domain-containing protein